MKLVYMTDLKSVAVRHGGSSPPSRTNRRNCMSKQDETLQRAYGNMPKEIGFNEDLFSWMPTLRGVKYYWHKLIRKVTR